jgi:phosphoribosylformylglycinamidine synthase
VLRVPISHGQGNYFADPDTLAALESEGRVLFRYCSSQGDVTPDANPNGSLANIAGIASAQGNVLGMMPHPERCCEHIVGGEDGRFIFQSLLNAEDVGRE